MGVASKHQFLHVLTICQSGVMPSRIVFPPLIIELRTRTTMKERVRERERDKTRINWPKKTNCHPTRMPFHCAWLINSVQSYSVSSDDTLQKQPKSLPTHFHHLNDHLVESLQISQKKKKKKSSLQLSIPH